MCVYGVNPLLLISLINLPLNDKVYGDAKQQAKAMLKILRRTKDNIEKSNVRYQQKANNDSKGKKTFQVGDFVWIYLKKERFYKQKRNKLIPKATRSFQIIRKYGDNAYNVALPKDYEVSHIFNVGELRPYYRAHELRKIFLEEGGNEPRATPRETSSSGPSTIELQNQSNSIQDVSFTT